MNIISTSCFLRRRIALGRSACAGTRRAYSCGSSSTAFAADKPPLAPDTVAPFTTDSRISATIEFGLRALASDIDEIFRNGSPPSTSA